MVELESMRMKDSTAMGSSSSMVPFETLELPKLGYSWEGTSSEVGRQAPEMSTGSLTIG